MSFSESNCVTDNKVIFNAKPDRNYGEIRAPIAQQNDDNYSNCSLSDSSSNRVSNRDDIDSAITTITIDHSVNHSQYFVPIEGYEVMEQRSRYTVFRLRVENLQNGQSWLVFRRYTDFARLRRKLRTLFPRFSFALPSKNWFGDNFDAVFLEDRQLGLQVFLNNLMSLKSVTDCQPVRDFLCLSEESHDESVVLECSSQDSREQTVDSTIYSLNKLLKFKDDEIQFLRRELNQLKSRLSLLSTDDNPQSINQRCDEQLISGAEVACPQVIVETRDSPDGCCSHTSVN